ncbi:MAG: LysR family transcriptional regulator [Woeseia sp.]
MTAPNRITLEQWRALTAVVDAGGYAQAAEALNKSQSTITYAVKKLEETLDVSAFEIKGRRAVLTSTGELLYRRALQLLDDAARLEQAAKCVSAGWEPVIGLSVEVLYPTWLLLEVLARFGEESPHTHIELYESVMGGTQENLLKGRAALAITPVIPVGFLGEPIMSLTFLPVAHPEHALHTMNRELTAKDLRRHRHLIVRESGSLRDTALGMQSEMRWTVSNMSTSIGAVCRGYGYAWFPAHKIQRELAEGVLKPLPLRGGGERMLTVYLVLADPDGAGPGVARLAEMLRDSAKTVETRMRLE